LVLSDCALSGQSRDRTFSGGGGAYTGVEFWRLWIFRAGDFLPIDGRIHTFRIADKPDVTYVNCSRCPSACYVSTSIYHLRRHALWHESGELALECLAYSGAPALGDGLGRGIGEDFLFAFFQAVEGACGHGFG
jgi:hypothetical protein